ncbi:hypothetical protein FQR65_LT17345 [Abscondita terminalis]|nr:hypothetical protein FQR65_LT17345 [Abscondita terminalis]
MVENTIADINPAADDHKPAHGAAATSKVKIQPEEDIAIEVGDWVKIVDSGNEAQVIEVARNNNLILALGDYVQLWKRSKLPDFSPEVDVRGMRTEDALHQNRLRMIERYDRISSLKLFMARRWICVNLYGNYLRKYSHVSRFEDEQTDREETVLTMLI